MFLLNLFNIKRNCSHNHIAPNIESGYCPDCGKFIRNEWYITRCTCCGVKMKAIIRNNEIVPQYNFCENCGSREYVAERIPSINFIDINYAVLLKKVIEPDLRANTTQCWQEKSNEPLKLLAQYL